MAVGAAHDGSDMGDQFAVVVGLGQKVIGAETEASHPEVDLRGGGDDHDRRPYPGRAELLHQFAAGAVLRAEIENDDVVIVQLADGDPVFVGACGVADEILRRQDRLGPQGGGHIVGDDESAHFHGPLVGSIKGNDAAQPSRSGQTRSA